MKSSPIDHNKSLLATLKGAGIKVDDTKKSIQISKGQRIVNNTGV